MTSNGVLAPTSYARLLGTVTDKVHALQVKQPWHSEGQVVKLDEELWRWDARWWVEMMSTKLDCFDMMAGEVSTSAHLDEGSGSNDEAQDGNETSQVLDI